MESQQQINKELEKAGISSPNAWPSTGIESVTSGVYTSEDHAFSIQFELEHVFDKMKAIRAFVFDVDGVFTNNQLLVTENGEFLRSMHVRDGQALKWAVKAGYVLGIITGGSSEGVKQRFTKQLGVQEYYAGIHDKALAFQSFLQRTGLNSTEICYVGDDLPDLPPLRKSALACCPADAVPEVKAVADYISPWTGGNGCVRDIVEKVMKIQGKWPKY